MVRSPSHRDGVASHTGRRAGAGLGGRSPPCHRAWLDCLAVSVN